MTIATISSLDLWLRSQESFSRLWQRLTSLTSTSNLAKGSVMDLTRPAAFLTILLLKIMQIYTMNDII